MTKSSKCPTKITNFRSELGHVYILHALTVFEAALLHLSRACSKEVTIGTCSWGMGGF